MRLIELPDSIFETLVNWKFAVWALSMDALLLSCLLLPSFFSSGLIPTVYLIKTNLSIGFLIFLSLVLWCFYLAHLLFYTLLGTLNSMERKEILDYILNGSMLLQLAILDLGNNSNNGIEILIWGSTFVYYCFCRVLSITAKLRFQNNHVRNLKELIFIPLGLAAAFIIGTASIFSYASFSLILLLNYDGILVLKESLITLYVFKHNLALSRKHELIIQLTETSINVCRWLHLVFFYAEWFLSSSLQAFFVIMKLQKLVSNLFTITKKCFQYNTFMNDFIKNYPPLTQEDLINLEDERCCICWEGLTNLRCSRITCGHIHHVDCIRTWVLSGEKKCPLCKQVFLEPETSQKWSFLSNLL
ncbi:unnamed protein product [Blepharisma stoltei]|uniref:RING-type domain-containing protein n=1 Tax=Blepharisma stoltei TaxID=1481888 RepID=A0AAU9JJS7_9CILI|nr:unnamed protein product [Blepharisma stoltei]